MNISYIRSDILYLGSSCAWLGTFAELAGQHRNHCPLASVACPHPGCPWKGVRKGLKQHLVLCLSLSCVCLYMYMYVCTCMYMYLCMCLYPHKCSYMCPHIAPQISQTHHKTLLSFHYHYSIYVLLHVPLYVPSYVPQMNTEDQYKPWHGPAGAGCLLFVCVLQAVVARSQVRNASKTSWKVIVLKSVSESGYNV